MKIELLGASFSIQSDEDDRYLESVVSFFSRKVSQLIGTVKSQDPLKISIIAGILIADELLKQRAEAARVKRGSTSSSPDLLPPDGNDVAGAAIGAQDEAGTQVADSLIRSLICQLDEVIDPAPPRHPG